MTLLVLLTQQNPWASVLNSDNPRVAVYDDGTLIFVKPDTPHIYHHAMLTPTLLDEARQRIEPVIAFPHLETDYNLHPNWDDFPRTSFQRVSHRWRIRVLRQAEGEPRASALGVFSGVVAL